ncbi:MAG: hypothetical protein FJ008_08095 [Chloroflexi bacterium]|nr:hypothetical protein [Chloroflexota bacterium]MBM3175911.1 hypothetical protein [Chloroflexota bacterium]MBM4450514.1 hypothetical protein [Chloroflexota bacterium]
MIRMKKLQQYGQYSRCLIIPHEWLMRHGNPEQVLVRIGRRRIVIEMPVKENMTDGEYRN